MLLVAGIGLGVFIACGSFVVYMAYLFKNGDK